MKQFISTILILTLVTFSSKYVPANASATVLALQTFVEKADNGNYYETIITDDSSNNFLISTLSVNKTITKTKTTYYKNISGTVLWSVSIKATFSYNGTTSKCTSCSHSTTAPAQSWSIKSCSSSKSGNTATAKAVAKRTAPDGSTNTVTKSVTIKCSPTGKIS